MKQKIFSIFLVLTFSHFFFLQEHFSMQKFFACKHRDNKSSKYQFFRWRSCMILLAVENGVTHRKPERRREERQENSIAQQKMMRKKGVKYKNKLYQHT